MKDATFSSGFHTYEEYGQTLHIDCDVCIIGAGAGGGAVAAALAGSGLRVALMEEGRHWRPQDFRSNTAFAYKNLYQGQGARSMRGNAVIPLPGGKGVGGSTLINSAICFRTPPDVLEQWRAERGCYTIEEEAFERRFERIWKTLGIAVNAPAVQGQNNLVFHDGATKLGLSGGFMERSAPGCVGCGVCQFGCPSGGKSSVDRTFIAQAVASGDVGVYADCRIRTGIQKGEQLVEVRGQTMDPQSQRPTGSIRVRAQRFVLCAGPIGSPMFLLGNRLTKSKDCGRHLVVHPTVSALGRFVQQIRPWYGVTQGAYVDNWQEGFLLQTFTLSPDQYHLLIERIAHEAPLEVMNILAHVAAAGALVHDEDSEGRVRHTPAGPDISYVLGDGDRKRLIAGLRMVAAIFFEAGAKEVWTGRMGVGSVKTMAEVSDVLLDDIPAHHLSLYASHPMGTCRMGGESSNSVVDPHGRVWGLNNLYVADASVFPTSLGVNPQVTTMAMGLMIGEGLLAAS